MADKRAEAEFFNEEYSSNVRSSVGQVYSIIKNRDLYYERLILDDVQGLRVLEYGCGTGSHSLEMARRGAHVVGIDISSVGVDIAREKAEQAGLANAIYEVMDAEAMTFPDASFDLIIGEGILHHLDLEKSFSEIARVLKEDGRAVFQEPLGHNPAIEHFRRMTPRLRTEDEHPLKYSDLKLARRYFHRVDCRYFHLVSFASLALLKTPFFFRAVDMLDRVDAALFRLFPFLGVWSWYTVMTMSAPIRPRR